jgi:hypothetical protein
LRRVIFDPATLENADRAWWDEWRARAEAERTACLDAYAAGHSYEFVSDIWRMLKEFFLRCAFNNRCGYCESPVTVVTHGDADHFRPKKKVTVEVDGKAQTAMCGEKPHPGYYWLAYDWRNLVPACEKCNRASGKMNQFPVQHSHYCAADLKSDELDEVEEPLLLNPHRESSFGVLRFGDQGTVGSVDNDARGECSIGVYRLDREDLATERFRAQKAAWREWLIALGHEPEAGLAVLAKWKNGSEPYSRAVLDYIELMWNEYRPELGEA